MLLILSNRQDFAVDYSILRLEERGVPYFRLNGEDLGKLRFTFELRDGHASRSIRNKTRMVDLSTVTAVWLRRQLQPTLEWVNPADRSFAATELRFFLDSFLELPSLRWVNPPRATHLGERKLYVLERAAKVGLSVPHTVATNHVASFRGRPSGDWIGKPVYQGVYNDGRDLHAVYTQRLDQFGEVSDAEIEALPSVYQREVKRGRDLRLTFVGEEAFGAVVEWDAAASVDWRSPRANAVFTTYEIPDALRSQCRSLMRDLGLVYGAFDFIEDAHGEPWFLEVNPAGEFAWLELQLGFPIRDAFITTFQEAA